MFNLLMTVPEFIYGNIDLILLAVFVIFTLIGIARGFCAQLAGLITTVIGFVLACVFAKSLVEVINKYTPWTQEISNALGGWVNNNFPSLANVDVSKIAENIQALPLPEAIKNTVSSYALSETGESINLCDLISKALANYLVLGLCFIAIYLVTKLFFAIFRGIARKLRNITLVRLVDDLLGGLLAFAKTLILLYLVIFIINILPLSILDDLKVALTESKVLNFINEHNLFDYLLKLLQL